MLRTRSHRPVFTFWNSMMGPLSKKVHCWLAKPSPLFPTLVSVTSEPGLVDLVVRARFRFSKTSLSVVEKTQRVHSVLPFFFGFRIEDAPEWVLLGVPR